MKPLAFYVLAITAAFAISADAGIYKWVDNAGTVHYADDLSSVPLKHRKRLKQIKEAPVPEKEEPIEPVTPAGEGKLLNKALVTAPDSYIIHAARYGDHFLVTADINGGKKTRFIIDTGATLIALTPKQAELLNIHTGPDVPKAPFSTAAGLSWQPLVVLDSVKIGGAVVRDVEASVMQSDSDVGLLGMSFLGEFRITFNNRESSITLARHGSDGESYGGYDGEWWRRKFFYYTNKIRIFKNEQQKIKENYELGKKSDLENDTDYINYRRSIDFYRERLRKLDRRASRASVPKRLRRYP
ncbi:MAG: TIGR02281 family clan AA aspartic protease [Nitrospinota bacterium]